MGFDLATAKPVADFDLSTATPIEQPKKKPDVTASERVGAVGAGANRGISGLVGLPVDTLLNVWDLAKAGVGTAQGAITGKTPSEAFNPTDRSQVVGASDWIAGKMDKTPVTTTQMARPDDAASRYLYAAGSALPAAATMQPSTMGQGVRAVASNVIPAMTGQVASELFPNNPAATISGSLLGQLAGAPLNSTRTRTPNPVREKTLANSQAAGYVVPPSTTNPTVVNKLLESFGGKIATQQDASIKNMSVTDALTKKALGLHPDQPITQDALNTIRTDANPAYKAVENVGTVTTDTQYSNALNKLAATHANVGKNFPGIVNNEIGDLVKSLDQPTFDAKAGIDVTKVLREKASKAYMQGDKSLGAAYKQASDEIESVIERNLAAVPGKNAAKTLHDFRDARKMIAKTYTVEKALNDATGNVDAKNLANQLSRGKPLSGDLLTAAKFGQAFPKAAQQINDSGSVRNTDVLAGGAASLMSGNPVPLAYPFGRMAAREYLLSPQGQKRAIPPGLGSPQLLTPEQRRALILGNSVGLLGQ